MGGNFFARQGNFRSNSGGLQGKLTPYSGKKFAWTVSNGCKYWFLERPAAPAAGKTDVRKGRDFWCEVSSPDGVRRPWGRLGLRSA